MIDEMEVVRHFKSAAPVDVVRAIEALGISYFEKNMAPEQSGYFKNTGKGYEIGVNIKDGLQRKRFTAAHELGHFILHRDMLGVGEHFDRLYGASASRNPNAPFSPRHEVQANQFAADFLMPAGLVKYLFSMSNHDTSALAERFLVSRASAEIRLKNLGILP